MDIIINMKLPSFLDRRKIEPAAPDDFYARVLSSHELIEMHNLSLIIERLSTLVAVPEDYFTALYLTPINNILYRSQNLPMFGADSTSPLSSFKFHCILNGMKIKESRILPKNIDAELINEQKDIWRYVVFISLLMYGVGSTLTSRNIEYFDRNPNNTTNWNPYGKPMPIGSKYLFSAEKRQPEHSSSLTFLPLVFQPNSLSWLMKNSLAYNTVLNSIAHPQNNEMISDIIKEAYQLEDPITNENDQPLKQKNHLADTDSPTQKELGEKFHSWLSGSVTNSHLTVDEPDSYVFRKGKLVGLLTPNIFQYYASLQNLDWNAVQKGFLKLGLHEMNPSENTPIHKIKFSSKKKVSNCILIPMTFKPRQKQERLTPPPEVAINSPLTVEQNSKLFLDWAHQLIIKDAAQDSSPLFIKMKEKVGLVYPDIFEAYASENTLNSDDILNSVINLSIHLKNNSDDFFSIPIGKTSKTKILLFPSLKSLLAKN